MSYNSLDSKLNFMKSTVPRVGIADLAVQSAPTITESKLSAVKSSLRVTGNSK